MDDIALHFLHLITYFYIPLTYGIPLTAKEVNKCIASAVL